MLIAGFIFAEMRYHSYLNSAKKIIESYKTLTSKSNMKFPKLYGDGKASEFICSEMVKHLSK